MLVSIIRDQPAWQRLPATTPRHITTLLQRCLQKDVKKRVPHIGVARLELGGQAIESQVVVPHASIGQRVLQGSAWLFAGAAVSAIAFVPMGRSATVGSERQVRFEIAPPNDAVFSGNVGVPRIALSRDGRRLVYQASLKGQPRLWVRNLDSSESRPITMEDRADHRLVDAAGVLVARWSGHRFRRGRTLKAVDVTSGVVRTICDVPGNQLAGAWSEGGTIVFSSVATDGVWKVASTAVLQRRSPPLISQSVRCLTCGPICSRMAGTWCTSCPAVASPGSTSRRLLAARRSSCWSSCRWLESQRRTGCCLRVALRWVSQELDLDRLQLLASVSRSATRLVARRRGG